ncbi:MAG TPA: hypothetical protein VNZ49_10125 [Bacteroidia bacterium]|jgi:hypothetical protein|nr:hypothetical protein [Bacteroidia bacterium]
MKIEEFINLVKTPVSAGEEHISSIEKIIADYPYFQTAHLLYTKALHNSGNLNYHTVLKRTSVVAGDRGLLYRLIQQRPEVKTIQPVKEEKTPAVREEKTISNISITYDVVPVLKTETAKPEIEKEEEVKPEIIIRNTKQTETLDEIVLKPVVEAYIETEILKITEKDEPESTERSFGDWLKALGQQTPAIQTTVKSDEKSEEKIFVQPKLKTRSERQKQLDKLLEEDLRISKPDPTKQFYAATEETRSSVIENEDFVTETLAKIYVAQGNRSKAIRAYEILSLKYPEKSAYFAALITEIKNTIK